MSFSEDVNKLWLFTVIFHVVASICVGFLTGVPFGGFIGIVTLWVLIAGLYRSKWGYIFSFFGLALTIVLLWNMEAGYLEVFAVNAVTFMMVLATSKDAGMNPMGYAGLKRITPVSVILVVLMTLCMIIACGYVNALMELVTPDVAGTMSVDVNGQPVSAIVVYAILPAIVEEFMFRGCLIRGLGTTRKFEKIRAVVLSALMFSLLHLNVNQMGYALVAGLILGAVYIVTENLSLTVIMHLLFNLYSLILAMLPEESVLYKCMTFRVAGYAPFNAGFRIDGEVSSTLLVAGTGSLIVAVGLIILLIVLLKKNSKTVTETEKDSKERGDSRNAAADNADWKPDGRFWIGCIICIVVAVIFEINLLKLMG